MLLTKTLTQTFEAISISIEESPSLKSGPATSKQQSGDHNSLPSLGVWSAPATRVRCSSSGVQVALLTISTGAAPAVPAEEPARLRTLHGRYCAAVSALEAFNSALALPALLATLGWFVLAASLVAIGSGSLSAGSGGGPLVHAELLDALVQAAAHGAALCWAGQRLEEAARRPAELLLRAAPAGAWAAQLVHLMQFLQPALTVPGLISINIRLLLSVTVGFVTYTVVLLQMI